MRITKQVSALAAAAALMAPAAAAAAPFQPGAHRSAIPAGSCRVSLFAAPHEVANGEAAEVYGRLGCIGATAVGQTVTVYGHTAGATAFTVLDTATTGPAGFYSYIAPKLTTDTTFYASAEGATSASKQVKVAPLVSLETAPLHPEDAALLTGAQNHVTFTGVVSPADAGARVVLQRENATSSGFTWFEEWRAIQVGTVGAGGAYSITHTFVLPGEANLRVLVRPYHRLDVRGMSNTLSYEISQPQNASLTLTGAPNPISDGQKVTLTGKVAGASDAPVTLMAHTDGSDPFTKVATIMTNSSGEYTFTESPTESTYYQVDSGTAQSTVQFEGVKYVLTATASTEALHSGEAATFSGTVTPIRKGHIVYLERENTGPRGGWHVVDTGAVSETGGYTIADYVFGSGSGTYRVLIPGDFANQAMASQTFPITVSAPTSAPPAVLPAATLPSEGKV
jgi:hypothetical protein